eukprot:ANDGO_06315.mRNA.1 putative WD repeat-containing protein alr2800
MVLSAILLRSVLTELFALSPNSHSKTPAFSVLHTGSGISVYRISIPMSSLQAIHQPPHPPENFISSAVTCITIRDGGQVAAGFRDGSLRLFTPLLPRSPSNPFSNPSAQSQSLAMVFYSGSTNTSSTAASLASFSSSSSSSGTTSTSISMSPSGFSTSPKSNSGSELVIAEPKTTDREDSHSSSSTSPTAHCAGNTSPSNPIAGAGAGAGATTTTTTTTIASSVSPRSRSPVTCVAYPACPGTVISSISFSPTVGACSILAVGTLAGVVQLYTPSNSTGSADSENLLSAPFASFQASQFSWIDRPTFSRDAQLLSISCPDEGAVKFFDPLSTASGPVHSLRAVSYTMFDLFFCPDGRVLALGMEAPALFIGLWDALTGVLLRRFSGHTSFIFDSKFSPDGNLVVSVSDDYSLRIWDIQSGECKHVCVNHTMSVQKVFFSKGKSRGLVASTAVDGKVNIYDIELGALMCTVCQNVQGALWIDAALWNSSVCLASSRGGLFVFDVADACVGTLSERGSWMIVQDSSSSTAAGILLFWDLQPDANGNDVFAYSVPNVTLVKAWIEQMQILQIAASKIASLEAQLAHRDGIIALLTSRLTPQA